MKGQVRDNIDRISSPTPESSQPETTQTALKLTQATAGTNTTCSVVPGRYRFTAYAVGGFRFGLASVATDGNVRWLCPLGRTIEIDIPGGTTTLNYTTDVNSALGFLVKLQERAA